MKKKIFFFAAAAAMMAACSSNDSLDTGTVTKTETTLEQGAVGFDAYTGRTTRSGDVGVMTENVDNTLKLRTTGFGVFGYYTDNNEYDGQTIPNFFYNEKISYSTYWSYEPVKYWPNEYGNSAIADDADKVSYFAYAPYVPVTPATGKASDQSYGITQLSRNSNSGDPYVKYIASLDWEKSVDLLWGVVPSANTTWKTVAGQDQTLVAGKPWLDVERPVEAKTQDAAFQRVKFQFEHALSQLNVQVDYDADATDTGTDNPLAATTRVYVRNVTFTGFSMKGALNLNNTTANTPLWLAYDGQSDMEQGTEVIVNDGRKDGREGASAANETNTYLNPALVQAKSWTSDNKGVRAQAQNLFAFPAASSVAADMIADTQTKSVTLTDAQALALSNVQTQAEAGSKSYTSTDGNAPDAGDVGELMLNWPVMVIPNGEEMTITITYDVETVDNKLATTLSDGSAHGSSIENKITKTITFSGAAKNYLEAGKKYTVKLHLGLNSVKFDAAVSDWGTGSTGVNWLPYNETVYQAPGSYNYNLAATTTTSDAFKLSGFTAGETVSATYVAPVNSLTTSSWSADVNGIVTVAQDNATIESNASVINVTTDDAITFTGALSGKTVTINLVQNAAQPDGTISTLAISNAATTGTFTLKDATNTLTGAVWTGSTRNVTIVSAYRNGVAMTEVAESASPSGTLQFKCSAENEITLGSAAATGETFIFTIKAGDAGEVTIKCTVA